MGSGSRLILGCLFEQLMNVLCLNCFAKDVVATWWRLVYYLAEGTRGLCRRRAGVCMVNSSKEIFFPFLEEGIFILFILHYIKPASHTYNP